ncbi:MAG TPA: hypothetical protein VFL86_09325 [Burkholderiaceae bacterium]|nr:hypothetical protein [Burkholderiaceae bacterium]
MPCRGACPNSPTCSAKAWLAQTLAPGRLEAERKGLEFQVRWTGASPTVVFDDV